MTVLYPPWLKSLKVYPAVMRLGDGRSTVSFCSGNRYGDVFSGAPVTGSVSRWRVLVATGDYELRIV